MAAKKKTKLKQREFSKKTQSKILWGLSLSSFVILLSIWSFSSLLVFQKCNESFQFSPINIIISSPKYLSPNEIEPIYFSIENTGKDDANVSIVAKKSDMSFVMLGLDDNNSIFDGVLSGQEYVNKKVSVFIPWDVNDRSNLLGENSSILLSGTINGNQVNEVVCVSIAPIPWIRSISNIISPLLFGLVAWMIKMKWDQINKDLEGK